VVLFSAAVLGITYIFLVPPWQHNDEPTKFEFAWLLANQQSYPRLGDYDQGMRREVAASMIEHGFFREWNSRPNLISIQEPVWIGISQINDEPLYYYLASLPLRLFRFTDITFQLYTSRFVSLLLYLFTVWIVILASKELFSEEHPLSKIVPLFVAFLPGFVDLMTAVNDDVGAVAFLTLFFFASIRILKKGLNFTNIAILIVSLLLCLFTKRTAWLAIPLGGLVLYLAIFRSHHKLALVSIAVFAVIGILFTFSWTSSSPAFFYSPDNRSLPLRPTRSDAQVGNQVITMRSGSQTFHQPLGANASRLLAEEKVTLGMWAWASEPVNISYPQLRVNGGDIIQAGWVQLNNHPTFYSSTGLVPEDASWVVLTISPGVHNSKLEIYWDCLILIKGDYGPEPLPNPMDKNCAQIGWGDQVHENYIRNASGEKAWPVLNDKIASFVDKRFSFAVVNLYAVLDHQSTWQYFYSTSAHLFRTFWGKFGWGEVSLLGSKPYRVFLFLTVAAIIGWVVALWKDRPQLYNSIFLFLALAAISQIVMTLFRGAGNWYNYIYTPNARYAYPSIFPIGVIMSIGWWSLTHNYFRSGKYNTLLFVFLFVSIGILNVWAMFSIWTFYYR
jgi:hypothetical protein